MNTKSYLVILLLVPIISFAQSNYKSGYVINLKGDTLRGYVNFKEWSHNPTDITFKKALNEKASQFGVNDISYFEVTGASTYQRFEVAISLNSVDISSAPPLSDTSSKTDIVFLKILEKGRYVTLYGYSDALKPRFYIKENSDSAPIELKYGAYDSPGGYGNVLFVTTYKDQLTMLAAKYVTGWDKFTNNMQYVKYNAPDLVPVAAKINGDAVPPEAVFSGKYPGYRLFAGAAYELSTMRYNEEQPFGSSPSTTGAPKFCLGIDVFANPAVGHLIFRLEAAYANHTGYQFNGQTLSQSTVSVTPQAIYNLYNADALKVFVNVGYTLNFSSYNNSDVSEGLSYADKWGDPQLKAGMVLAKKFEIYASYYPSTPLTNYGSFALRISSYQFGLNYFIK